MSPSWQHNLERENFSTKAEPLTHRRLCAMSITSQYLYADSTDSRMAKYP